MKSGYWETIIYKDLSLPDKKYEAIIKGVARTNQFELLKNIYKTRFFEDFPYILKCHGRKYATLVFKHMNPSFIVNEAVFEINFR